MIKMELIKCLPQENSRSAFQIPPTTTVCPVASGGAAYVALTQSLKMTIAIVNNG